jgi:VanZ family protein
MMLRKLSRMAFIIGLLAVIALSLLPPDTLPRTGTWEKLNHVMAYAALALAGGLGFTGLRSLLLIGIGLLILGTGLELVQAALPDRSASTYDALANIIGISLGSIVANGMNAHLQKRAQIIS